MMVDNLVIQVEFSSDRISTRNKCAWTVAFDDVPGLGKLPFYH